MFFDNYLIFIYISLFIICFRLADYLFPTAGVRNVTILIGNLLILLTLVKEHTLIVLAILSSFVFLSGLILQSKKSKALLTFILTLILTLFVIRNYPYIQNAIEKTRISFINSPILSVQKIGLSYILFRYIHWLVESYRNTIYHSNLLTFLNYIFFFPSILAGPIDTYKNFQYWVSNKHKKYKTSLFGAGIMRIFLGAFKTLGIVPLVINYATDYHTLLPHFTPIIAILISLLFYSLYIYFDFSGYSDIAIGTAYLVGIKTPENFNNPYTSTNLSEFWKRWHITFSDFLRIYVFTSFIKLYNKIIKSNYRLPVTILCYLSTFLICGAWHGDTINFIYWGLWHGAGLSFNKIWTSEIKPNLSFCQSKTYVYGSIGLTFLYVSIGWIFFHYNHEELIEILSLVA